MKETKKEMLSTQYKAFSTYFFKKMVLYRTFEGKIRGGFPAIDTS